MTSDQLESLLRELAVARKSADELKQELKTIQESPAWRFVTAYRSWLSKSASGPVRIVDRAARFSIRLFFLAGSRESSAAHLLDGELVHCLNPMYLGRFFYCRDGKRHWVRSKAHLKHYGPHLSLKDVVQVSDEDMRKYELAGPLPLPWPAETWAKPDRRSMAVLREIAVSRLRGSGIEFGAGTDPLSVPLCCDVKYADQFREGDLRNQIFYGPATDHVSLSYKMSLEDLGAVADGSLDFVIATHLIQQVRNPLRAFEEAHRKLKPGGSYVLIIPDMRRMFDRDRELTTLEHLVSDYQRPSAERDVPHYSEFFKKVRLVPNELLAEQVKQAITTNDHIHFHTWTYESFGEMVKYIRRKVVSWRSVWSQPCIDDSRSYEFYFVLEK